MAHIITIYRTPIRKRFGVLKEETAVDLLVPLVKKTLETTKDIDEFIVGCSIQANVGQNLAKQVLSKCDSKTNRNTVCYQVNKVCASSMKALDIAINRILLGKADCILVGGVESMSNMPTYNTEQVDSLIRDGLTCSISDKIMGKLADATAEKFSISRKDLDEVALSSYGKYKEAYEKRLFEKVKIPVKNCSDDERFSCDPVKLKKLRPIFNESGVHTAGNSSKLADGAAIVLLASKAFIQEKGLQSLAEIVASEDFENKPEDFIEAPVGCIQKLLNTSHMKKDDISVFEINEAFATVPLLVSRQLEIPIEKINPTGGAVAFGHPLGASGLIILSHLILSLKDQQYGCLAICNGGGGASGIIIKKNQFKFHKEIDLHGCRNPKVIQWRNQILLFSSKKFKTDQDKIKYLLFKDVLDENMDVIHHSSHPVDLESLIPGYLEDINVSVWLRDLYFEESHFYMLVEIKKNIENKYFHADFLLIKTTDFESFVLDIQYPYKDCFLFKVYKDIAFISEIQNTEDFIWGIYLFSFQSENQSFAPQFDKYVDYSKDKGHVMNGLYWDSDRNYYIILFSIRHEIGSNKYDYQIYEAETTDFKTYKNTIKLGLAYGNSEWFCYPFHFYFEGRQFMICNQDDFGKEKKPVIFEKNF